MAVAANLAELALGGGSSDAAAADDTSEPDVSPEEAMAGEDFAAALKSGDGAKIFGAFRDLQDLCGTSYDPSSGK